MKDIKTKTKAIELRAEGLSFDKIAQRLKVSKLTLIKWAKENQIEITNLRAINLEALQEQFFAQKEARIKLLGTKLGRLQKEAEGRDLTDIPTEKLFTLIASYSKALKEEETQITFAEEDSLIDFGNPVATFIV